MEEKNNKIQYALQKVSQLESDVVYFKMKVSTSELELEFWKEKLENLKK